MSHIPYTETIFAIESSPMQLVFDFVHGIFRHNSFQLENLYSSISLNAIEDETGEDDLFESISIDYKTLNEGIIALQRLRVHPTGGTLSYSGLQEKFATVQHPDYYPYGTITSFGSFDNKQISYILITVRERNFNHFNTVFNQICTEIAGQLPIIGLTRRIDYDQTPENGDDIARHLINGTIQEVSDRLQLLFDFL